MTGRTTLPQARQSRFLRNHFHVVMHLENDGLCAELRFDLQHEGPPGHAHGGSIATVLDETMGTLAFALGHQVLAGKLQVKYRKPTPLHEPLQIHCTLTERRKRQIKVIGKLMHPRGTVFAEGEGLYVDIQRRFNSLADENPAI